MKALVQEFRMHRTVYTVLLCVVAIALLLRFYALGATPFVADEFLDINATYGYHQTGERIAWDFNTAAPAVRQNAASDSRAWLYREQIATLFQFVPPTEFFARSISALWGVISVVMLYIITFSLTRNRMVAVLAAFLLAVSVPMIDIDRKIRLYALFVPVFMLFSWSIFQFLERARDAVDTSWKNIFSCQYIFLLPMIIFGLAAFHLHPLTGNIVFVVLAYLLWHAYYFYAGSSAQATRYALYALMLIATGIAVKTFFPSLWQLFSGSVVFFEDHWNYSEHILRNFWHPLIGGLLIIFGAWWLAVHNADTQRKQKAAIWIICNAFVIFGAAIFLWERNVGPQYIAFAQPFFLILAAAGMYGVYQYVKNIARPMVILILLALLIPNYVYFAQRNNTYHITSDADTPNYREVFVYIRKTFTPGEALVTRNFRSYYFNGFDATVYDFGSERSAIELSKEGKVKKMSRARMQEIMIEHPTGWIVYSDNDEQFIEKELQQYLENGEDDRIIKVDAVALRGKINVYRWE